MPREAPVTRATLPSNLTLSIPHPRCVPGLCRRWADRLQPCVLRLTWKDFVEHGFVGAGSAATVRDTLRDALTDRRVGHVMLLCQVGNLPDALARENTRRVAQDVMPQLRDLWSDYEERWYPQPLSQPGDSRTTELRGYSHKNAPSEVQRGVCPRDREPYLQTATGVGVRISTVSEPACWPNPFEPARADPSRFSNRSSALQVCLCLPCRQ